MTCHTNADFTRLIIVLLLLAVWATVATTQDCGVYYNDAYVTDDAGSLSNITDATCHRYATGGERETIEVTVDGETYMMDMQEFLREFITNYGFKKVEP